MYYVRLAPRKYENPFFRSRALPLPLHPLPPLKFGRHVLLLYCGSFSPFSFFLQMGPLRGQPAGEERGYSNSVLWYEYV